MERLRGLAQGRKARLCESAPGPRSESECANAKESEFWDEGEGWQRESRGCDTLLDCGSGERRRCHARALGPGRRPERVDEPGHDAADGGSRHRPPSWNESINGGERPGGYQAVC